MGDSIVRDMNNPMKGKHGETKKANRRNHRGCG